MKSTWRPSRLRPALVWGTPLVRLAWLALALTLGLVLAALPLPAALLLVAGAAVVIATLIEPLIGLAITLLAGPFGALESVILGGTSVDSGQLLLMLTLASWLASGVARRRIHLPRTGRLLAIPLLVFIGVGAVSLFGAPSLALGFKEIAKWVQMGLIAWFVADAAGRQPDRPARISWVLAAVLLPGLIQALIGIWQFGLRGHGPEHFLVLDRFYRAYGTYEQPNPYAGFLGLAFPLALGVGIGQVDKVRRRQSFGGGPGFRVSAARIGRLLTPLLVAIIVATALLMSWSRGAWLGVAVGLTAMAFFLPRRAWVGGLLVAALVVAGWGAFESGLVPLSVAGRLTGLTDYLKLQDVRGVDVSPGNYAVFERMAHWQAALNMADAHPWLGVGFGNYQAAYPGYALLNWPYPLGHAHNYYLNLLAEVGSAGLVAYLGFWAVVIWLTARVLRRAQYPQRGTALGLMGAWIHLSVHHLVDKLYVNNIYLHLGALLGLLLLLAAREDTRPD